MEEHEIVPYKQKEAKLHICNCVDDGRQVDPSVHAAHCNYRKWLERRIRELQQKKERS